MRGVQDECERLSRYLAVKEVKEVKKQAMLETNKTVPEGDVKTEYTLSFSVSPLVHCCNERR